MEHLKVTPVMCIGLVCLHNKVAIHQEHRGHKVAKALSHPNLQVNEDKYTNFQFLNDDDVAIHE